MKLKEFVAHLNDFIEKNPDALEMDVITSKDDEGNGFNNVYFTPQKGIFDDGDFIPVSRYEEYGRDEDETNAVCIN